MPHHLPCLPPRRRRSAAALLLAALWVPACTVGPDYATPQVPLPENWPGLPEGSVSVSTPQAADASDAPAAAAAQRDAAGNASQPGVEEGLSRWWTAFHDDTLDGLVEQAIAGNLDVQRAEARVLEARAQRRVAGSGDEPQLNATADASRTERSANNTSGSAIPGSTRNLFSAGFDALWELDIFGGVRRNVEAADADLAAAQETRRDVLVTLLAEVSREYLDLRSAQRRVAIANDNLVTQQDTLELTRSRATAGLASDLDLARAEAQAAGTRATLPPLQTAERAALHRLDVLMGRAAGDSAGTLLSEGALPPPPPRVPLGLPSELLRRRPDIRSAERAAAAATARIGVSIADLYPKFSLTGSLGLSSELRSDFFDNDSRYWSIGGGLDWPLLDGGLRRALVEVAEARAQDALLNYRQVVLSAFEETANALVAFGREQERRQTLLVQAQAQRRAADLATALNEAGLAGFLDVLQAQAQRLAAEDSLALSERDLSADYVALCKALGGGWDAAPDVPPGDETASPPAADAPSANAPAANAPQARALAANESGAPPRAE